MRACEGAQRAADVGRGLNHARLYEAVNGDTTQLDRVMMNLLSNALKFTTVGGSVTVTAADEDGSAVVCVRDNGIGIPQRDRKDLFTRFFRGSNIGARLVPGTGLGLWVSRTIAADHGGDVDIQSQEGIGTTATMRLPLRRS